MNSFDLQVSEMMRTYLHVSGQGAASAQVDELCQRLEASSTREEVDAVNTLLADFTGLSLNMQPASQPDWNMSLHNSTLI